MFCKKDVERLEKLKKMKNISYDDFEKELRKILGQKVWWTNMPDNCRDISDGTVKYCNYRCTVPDTIYFYCLQLDRSETISVVDGFLSII